MTWYKTWETKINTPNTAYSRTVANGIQHWAVRGHQEATIRAFHPGRGAELDYFEAWFEDKMDGAYAWPRAKCLNNRIITNAIAPKLKKSGKPEGRRRTLQADPRTRLDLGLCGEGSPHPKSGNKPRPSPEIAIGGAQHLLCIFVVYPWSLLWSLTASMNL